MEFTTLGVTVGTEAAGLAGKHDKLFRPSIRLLKVRLKPALRKLCEPLISGSNEDFLVFI